MSKPNILEIKLETSPQDKAKMIERAIELSWVSLESHLEVTHTITSTGKKYKDEVGDEEFHKECVQQYSEIIFILSRLYD